MFTIKERIRFHAPIKSPIFTYTIRDKKGTDLTGTNTMYEGCVSNRWGMAMSTTFPLPRR